MSGFEREISDVSRERLGLKIRLLAWNWWDGVSSNSACDRFAIEHSSFFVPRNANATLCTPHFEFSMGQTLAFMATS